MDKQNVSSVSASVPKPQRQRRQRRRRPRRQRAQKKNENMQVAVVKDPLRVELERAYGAMRRQRPIPNMASLMNHFNSAESLKWILRVLSPCHPLAPRPIGIPDTVGGLQMSIDQKLLISIPPPTYTTNKPAGATSWNVVIYIPPSQDQACWILRRWDGDNTDVTPWVLSGATTTSSPVWTSYDYQSFGTNYWSQWYYPEWQASGSYLSAVSMQSRRMYHGITCYLIANSMSDQGMITATQIAPGAQLTTKNYGTNQVADGEMLCCYPMPSVSSEGIYQLGDRCFEGEARKGIYMPLRMAEGTILMQPTQQLTRVAFVPRGGQGAYSPDQDLVAWQTHHAVMDNNFNAGIIRFDGLSATGQPGGDASIRLKIHCGLNFTPQVGSIYNNTATVVEKADEAAIAFVADVSDDLPLAFEASENDLGSIFGTIANVAKSIGNVAHPIASAIGDLNIPMVSPIAKAVSGVLNAFGFGR